MKTIQERIIELRIDNDLKQEDVAQKLGMKQQQYSRYETGKNKLSVDFIIKICEYYKVSADYILFGKTK